MLVELVAPGGIGVLISDFVSSETILKLATIPDELLSCVLAQALEESNFFHGLNPAMLLSLCRTDSSLAHKTAKLEPFPPWRWNLVWRCYAVWALRIQKI